MSVTRPAQELQLAVGVFDQRRARLDPVPGVAIERTVDHPQVRAVDMPTDHAVVALRARMGRGDLLEASDIAHADANAELDSLGQRPVGPPQRTAQVIDAVA